MTEPLIGLLETVWDSIAELCEELSEDQWALPTDCPGWTVQDQVAHVIGTERMLLGEQPPEIDVDVKSFPHVKNDIGAFNELWIEHYRSMPGPEVLTELRSVTAKRLEQLRAMSEEDWEREGFTPEGPGPYRKFMAIRVLDCWFHEQDIRIAVNHAGHVDGPVVDLSMEKLSEKMPYVVGKRAGAPQGSTVVFDVAGPAGFLLSVGVDGRAQVLDELPDGPTVRMRMDDETFARLAGGRLPGDQALAEARIIFEGDEALGAEIIRNMGFMI